jgi:predicted HAD superfamily phosphohydrolase
MPALHLATDCEGPLALNDNAFELCRDFLGPQGGRFFQLVSRYDDCLADVLKRPDYQAGCTLKLILPFLKARGLTNAQVEAYSQQHLALTPGAAEAYRFLHGLALPIFMVSTSYQQFVGAVGDRLGFDPARLFCTELDLDRYSLAPGEAEELARLQAEILAAPDLQWPAHAKKWEDLPAATQETINRFDAIFWERLAAMDIGALLREVNLIGAAEKARAVEQGLAESGLTLKDTIYVGDSITDVQAFKKVRGGGGVALSFNGNRYAIEAAELVVVSNSAWSVALLCSVFRLWGKEGLLELASPETKDKSRYLVLPEAEIETIMPGLNGRQVNLYLSNHPKLEAVIKESETMRRRLRGDAVGALG